MVDAAKPIVTITGISGFIGSRVCLDFLACGEFTVRGTVRDKNNEAKVAPLRKAFGEYFDKLELVEADLLDADSLAKAIAGSTYVVHTASPVTFNVPDEQIIKPAVDGTLAVMKACEASGVKRCVVTSSMAAVCAMANCDKPDFDTGFYDETCWSNPERPEPMYAYTKSKTLAEKLAWDYVRDLPEGKKFELVTICPTLVLGPTLIPGGFSSANFLLRFFSNQTEVSNGFQGCVDVRDVSKMHLEAIRKPGAAGHRFISYAERVLMIDYAKILHEEFASKGYNVCITEKQGEREKDAAISNKKAREFFEMEFIPAKESTLAMAHSLIEHGVLKPTQ
jgi:nucleoside-diphosphate-sugar epimerase